MPVLGREQLETMARQMLEPHFAAVNEYPALSLVSRQEVLAGEKHDHD